MDFSSLSRAQLSFDYLHTNSTTHEFLFGALAELLDNSRDAGATKMSIFSITDNSLRGGFILCFLDDGEGMDPGETAGIVTFGKSTKKSDDLHQIGMYGNGLKSGSMRIGNDLMLFTKRGDTRSCLFLSRTFHEEEDIDEVIVPIPSFESNSRKPLAKDAKGKEKNRVEMEIILKYSPFKTEAHFFEQFDRIESTSGTLVMVYNLKLLDSGETELDILSDRSDIMLANPSSHDFDSDEGLMPERKSFRAYAAILYMDPRMRIYIQNKKVRTKRLAATLYKSKLYKYSSNRFKTRAENEAKRAIDDALSAENKAREAESKSKNLETKLGSSTNKEQRASLRKAQNYAAECRGNAHMKRQMAERKTKSLKDPKTLNLIFGLNIGNRNHSGVFVYNCSRLIKMYERVGPQNEGGVCCSGVVGIVDVPYLVLEPTHNKQDFADAKEYRHLMRAMGEHMMQYWKDVGIAQQGITTFWENFGYISTAWKDPPSNDSKYVRKRAMQLSNTLQCDMCLKWRMIPFNSSNIGKEFPDHWVCTMNPDQQHSNCNATEQKLNIPEGILKKEIKTSEQKKRDLEEEILKKTEMLQKLQCMKVVSSSKDVSEVLTKSKSADKEKDKNDRSSLGRRGRARSPSPPPRSPSPPPPPKSSRSSSQSSKEAASKAATAKRSRRSPSPPPPPPSRSSKAKPTPPPPIKAAQKPPSNKSAPPPKADKVKVTPVVPPKSRRKSPSPPPKRRKSPSPPPKKRKSPSPPPKKTPPSKSKKAPVPVESEEENEEEEEEEVEEETSKRKGRSRQVEAEVITPKETKRGRAKEPKAAEPEEVEEDVAEVEEEEIEEEETSKRKSRSRQVEPEVSTKSEPVTPKETKRGRAKEPVIEFPEIPVKKQRISRMISEPENTVDVKKTPSKLVETPTPKKSVVFEEKRNSSKGCFDSVIINDDSDGESKATRSTRSRGKNGAAKTEEVMYQIEVRTAEENEALPMETENSKQNVLQDVLGSRVEVMVNGKWAMASICEVSSTQWKVKFDHHPKDKNDKWFDMTDTENIKLLDAVKNSCGNAASPSSQEAPTSSTTTPIVSTQVNDDIASVLRTTLRYFLPPQWIMDKDAITAMSLQELSDFPLDDFFDHYERGLRRLVSNFQSEASFHKQEASDRQAKLISVRKLIAKLLKSTNEDFDIDPEESGDQVDELLAACVQQATAPPTNSQG